MMVVCLFVAASGSWIKWTCAHQGDLLLWSFPQACYLSNKPISILLSSETDYKFKSKKNSSTQSMSKWVMLYRTPFDKTQFLEISRCWRELRALPAQLDIPANHPPLLGKSWRGGRKSRHGLRTAFHTVTTTEDDFSLYFLSNGTPATPWSWFQIILLESEKTSAHPKWQIAKKRWSCIGFYQQGWLLHHI